MRHAILAAVLTALLAPHVSAFDTAAPSPWFAADPKPSVGRRHDAEKEVTSNGVTRVQMQYLYKEDFLVTDIDTSQAQGMITNLVAGDNVTIEDVDEDGRTKRISAVGGGEGWLTPDDVSQMIQQYDGTNITPRISKKQDALAPGSNVSFRVSGDTTYVDVGSDELATTGAVDEVRTLASKALGLVLGTGINLGLLSNRVDRLNTSNLVVRSSVDKLSGRVDDVTNDVSLLAARMPSLAPDEAYGSIGQRTPAIRIPVGGGNGFYLLCGDGRYYDCRTTSGYPDGLSSAYGRRPQFAVSSLYGRQFTRDYLSSLFGGAYWTSGFTLTVSNVDSVASSVCGAVDYPSCFGRPALVRDLVYDMLTRDSSLWYNSTNRTAYAAGFASVEGVYRASDDALSHADGAHSAAALLDAEYRTGNHPGVPIAAATDFSGVLARITLREDELGFYRTSDRTTIIAVSCAQSPADRRSRAATCRAVVRSGAQASLSVSTSSGWDSVVGRSSFDISPGSYLLEVSRVGYAADTGEGRVSVQLHPLSFGALYDDADSLTNSAEFATAVTSFVPEWARDPVPITNGLATVEYADSAARSATNALYAVVTGHVADVTRAAISATNDSFVAAVKTVAPAPGDYLNVSNAALAAYNGLETKRDTTDLRVYENRFGEWEFSDGVKRTLYKVWFEGRYWWNDRDPTWPSDSGVSPPEDTWYCYSWSDEITQLTLEWYTYGEPKDNIIATRSTTLEPTSDTLVTSPEVAKKADEFTKWEQIYGPDGYTDVRRNGNGWGVWYADHFITTVIKGDENSTSLSWAGDETEVGWPLSYIRKHVLYTGDADKLTDAQLANIYAVTQKADEFTEWVSDSSSTNMGVSYGAYPNIFPFSTNGWVVTFDGYPLIDQHKITDVGKDATRLKWIGGGREPSGKGEAVWDNPGDVTFTRKRVLRTGEAVTSQELTTAVLAEMTRATAVEDGIIEQIDAFKAFDIRVLDTLPTNGEAGVIYLVKAADYEDTKTRDEYLWSDATTNFNLIGSTRFDSSAIAKTKTTTTIPPSMTNHVSYVRQRESGGVTMPEDEDGSVVIGRGAVGTVDPEYIAQFEHDTTNVYLRSGSVAIGYNAVARDENGGRAQSIAIGWNSKASAVNSIAIGSGAVHWYETDESGASAVASAYEGIAIGYSAKVQAPQAVQLGRGVNGTARSLKFYDTWVVKDGKVQGGGPDADTVKAIAREALMDALAPSVVSELSGELSVKSHTVTTYLPTNGTPDDVSLTPTGSRNFELYLPNTPELRAGLPLLFDTEIDGDVTKLGPWWTNRVLRLPCMVTVREPLPNTVLLDVATYDTEWDWSPVVTRAYETDGSVRVEGTNLHFVAAVRIGDTVLAAKNPIYGAVRVDTNGVAGASGELIGDRGETLAEFTVE